MKAEVSKLIGEIQNQTETCVRVLEDAISRANETVKAAENRLEIINKELAKQKSEVVVLDALMSNNSERQKKPKKLKFTVAIPLWQIKPLLSKPFCKWTAKAFPQAKFHSKQVFQKAKFRWLFRLQGVENSLF